MEYLRRILLHIARSGSRSLGELEFECARVRALVEQATNLKCHLYKATARFSHLCARCQTRLCIIEHTRCAKLCVSGGVGFHASSSTTDMYLHYWLVVALCMCRDDQGWFIARITSVTRK